MKKLLCFTLTAVLATALAAPALADTNVTQDSKDKTAETTVQFKIDPAYTVTIPATVTLNKKESNGTVTYENDLTVTASNVRLNEGKTLQISLDSDFLLEIKDKPGFEKLPYEVSVNKKQLTSTDNLCAAFVTNTANQAVTLHFAAENPTYAGDYSDKVTFTLTVVDATPTGNGGDA